MDFSLTDEQRQLQDSLRTFARKEIRPSVMDRERNSRWDPTLWRRCGEMGIFGLPFPEEYGGSGASALTTALAIEALAHGANDSGLVLSIGAHMVIGSFPIWLHGTEAQRVRYLPKIITGERISAFALTEPNVGSDAAHIQTTARRVGDEYVVNGSKIFITNGPICDQVIVFAQTLTDEGRKGVSTFIVEKGTPGFTVARELDKMGNRTSPTAELSFIDCRIPAGNLIGEEGRGFEVANDTLSWERALMVSAGLGRLQNCIDESARYAQQRVQFGKPISEYQLIRAKLADMRADLEAARWQVYHVAWMRDQGIADNKFEASMSKLFLTESVSRAAEQAVQIHGGYGYMKEYPVEYMYRDARLGTIGGGTSEIQRLIISSQVLKGR